MAHITPYAGITRIRFLGSVREVAPSQPDSTDSPDGSNQLLSDSVTSNVEDTRGFIFLCLQVRSVCIRQNEAKCWTQQIQYSQPQCVHCVTRQTRIAIGNPSPNPLVVCAGSFRNSLSKIRGKISSAIPIPVSVISIIACCASERI